MSLNAFICFCYSELSETAAMKKLSRIPIEPGLLAKMVSHFTMRTDGICTYNMALFVQTIPGEKTCQNSVSTK